MKTLDQFLLLTLGAVALAGTAIAQVPSSNDTSAGSNTGMGSSALGGPTPANLTGIENTASGNFALSDNTSGSQNTGDGANSLEDNTTGSTNTAIGTDTLQDNTTGSDNTAVGFTALEDNNGNGNSAFGAHALEDNQTGVSNTASGEFALEDNLAGNNNTAVGYDALSLNQSGDKNTASGFESLYSNTTASFNSAYGFASLYATTTGQQNSALGVYALRSNTSGNYNTASGVDALYNSTTGSSNIAAGYRAGFKVTTGSNNIDIGNQGVAADDGTIRIGTPSTHKATFIAGIHNNNLSASGLAVVVTSTGELGVAATSSERFKTAIAPMGSDTSNLGRLRPVSFRFKSDATGKRQYGLIAEEVARVYPELVIRDEKGRIDGVRYDELAPMLLNEMQQQHVQLTEKIDAQAKVNAAQASEIRDLKLQIAGLNDLKEEMRAALRELKSKDQFVAQR
jgi:hypothetical protein